MCIFFTVNAVSANAFKDLQLDVRTTDMLSIVRAMARLDSGLEIRDRMWLKIVIPNSFIGLLNYIMLNLVHQIKNILF